MERPNAWNQYKKTEMKKVEALSAKYKDFLNCGKTERECVEYIVDALEKNGYYPLEKAVSGILLAGREEEVLKESIRRWKLDKLFEKEKDIVSRMDLADESGIDQDMMKTLTNDLIEVQKEIKKYGGR